MGNGQGRIHFPLFDKRDMEMSLVWNRDKGAHIPYLTPVSPMYCTCGHLPPQGTANTTSLASHATGVVVLTTSKRTWESARIAVEAKRWAAAYFWRCEFSISFFSFALFHT